MSYCSIGLKSAFAPEFGLEKKAALLHCVVAGSADYGDSRSVGFSQSPSDCGTDSCCRVSCETGSEVEIGLDEPPAPKIKTSNWFCAPFIVGRFFIVEPGESQMALEVKPGVPRAEFI